MGKCSTSGKNQADTEKAQDEKVSVPNTLWKVSAYPGSARRESQDQLPPKSTVLCVLDVLKICIIVDSALY